MFKIALAPVALAAAAVAAPAAAQTGAWRVGDDQIHLYYADLDMGSASGRAALLRRVEKAAQTLCDGQKGRRRDACIADTVRLASAGPKGAVLARAMGERDGAVLAAR